MKRAPNAVNSKILQTTRPNLPSKPLIPAQQESLSVNWGVGGQWGAAGLEMLAYLSGQNAKYQWAAGF